MKKDYENILSYVKKNQKSFLEAPLTEVDSLVFCTLSYLYLDPFFTEGEDNSFTIKDLAKSEYFDFLFRYFDEMYAYFDTLLGKEFDYEASRDLLVYMAANPRYRDISLSFYSNKMDEESNLQFGAMTFTLDEGSFYVAFRGTDWDIIGWKEDLLLALPEPVSSQYEAVEYLEKVGRSLTGKLYIGGHSKGGNLAVYGASKCSPKIQKRIEAVFSHDGPGFNEEFLLDEGFLAIQNLIHKTTPHSSYVAQLLFPDAKPTIVDSVGMGIVQHCPFYWKIEDDHFLPLEEPSLISHAAITKINDAVSQMTTEDRVYLLEIAFLVLEKLQIKRVGDFDKKFTNNAQMILKTISSLDAERKAFVHKLLRQFVFGGKLTEDEEKEEEHI